MLNADQVIDMLPFIRKVKAERAGLRTFPSKEMISVVPDKSSMQGQIVR
jgi:hypothetical protein